ncbi:flagellar hook-associated protein FlgK [Reinekea marinisedimentorum]|uniref:Flagellar hook-associated protein 1 n=1 Tax=Reinekea marinisedimentorum TaxID=230495 RepID=A0A4R3I2W6_9GAMM|nr:flagellar hook-associated protein FlgK [Reinekea marinisedimentorum]TCS39912.1 flagellar hook-associated protein 1 FlgK [Reinekea marinisedimentorum]
MSLLSTAVSGLSVAQTALDTTGNNISNANTEGYSRQQVSMETANSTYYGFGYVGNGVSVSEVSRITDEYLTLQLQSDTSDYYDLETYADLLAQVDTLLSNDSTGLQSAMDDYFAALQTAADDPSYVPSRDVVLAEAESLASQFNSIADYLGDIEDTLNSQLEASIAQVNSLATTIATLNAEIIAAEGSSETAAPNDLLDARDQAILELSAYVDTDVVEVDGAYDIYIGSGQALVLGNSAYSLEATPSEEDPTQTGITFVGSTTSIDITNEITSGAIAGMINFRENALDETINNLGLLAITFVEETNATHSVGIDLNGDWGGNFFADMNSEDLVSNRVSAYGSNTSSNDNYFSVYIDDTSALTGSEYTLSVPGPDSSRFEITNSDGDVVAEGSLENTFPQEIEFDGLKLVIESGTFKEGDSFTVNPYANAAAAVDVAITEAEEIALAYPIRADTSLSNNGTGVIDQGTMLSTDTSMFSVDGELSPPLIIVFTSETTYSVYDNTDPSNPTALDPPMENLSYVPGATNTIFTDDPGETQVSSWRARLPAAAETGTQGSFDSLENGINAERFEFYYTDPETGETSLLDEVSTETGTSAADIANALNLVDGIEARAYTEVQLTNFTNNGTTYNPSNDFEVWINGVNITDVVESSNQSTYMDGYPEEVPDEMTPDFLADRINSNYELSYMGITAKSDGTTLTITSANGDDILIEMTGDEPQEVLVDGLTDYIDPGDSFQLSNGQSYTIDPISGNTNGEINSLTGYDFTEGGPYEYEIYLPDGRTGYITMDQYYADSDSLLAAFEEQITDQLDDSSSASVSVDANGNLSYQVYMTVTGTGDPDEVSAVNMGGEVDIVMSDGISLETDPEIGGIFNGIPDAESTYLGFTFEISGTPVDGDEFVIEWNEGGTSDNRNALDLVALETSDLVGGEITFTESYAQSVEQVGTMTSTAEVQAAAAETILETTAAEVDSISGVNLDEEAAYLIEYQALYSANAKVITIAQELFDTLLASF